MKKKAEPTYEDILKEEYRHAVEECRNARKIFDLADQDYVEIAIMQLQAAEITLNAAAKKLKLYQETNPEFAGEIIGVEYYRSEW